MSEMEKPVKKLITNFLNKEKGYEESVGLSFFKRVNIEVAGYNISIMLDMWDDKLVEWETDFNWNPKDRAMLEDFIYQVLYDNGL